MEEAFASRKVAYLDTPAKGELAAVSDDLPQLLEREPRRFVEVVKSIFTEGKAND
ncbi:hypothetical protein [Neisseria elongata]|uniref:hypothetical protein n=1 Tax=Neisseria elongata TaxID=495 RepID=UPI001F1AF5C3|nr:hypothetical protein [Neisseria elongata]